MIIQGKGDLLDGFLFPHTCDSIQNMASIVNDYLGINKPCYFFYHPKAPYSKASKQYYKEQLYGLVSRLEKHFGPMDRSSLNHAVKQGQEMSTFIRDLYTLRANGHLRVLNTQFYRLIRSGEYLHPDDFIPLLKKFLSEHEGDDQRGPTVVLSGVLPNPWEILTFLDDIHIRIGDDDLLGCSRRLLVPEIPKDDPFDTLTEQYFAMPSCTTKNSPISERLAELMEKVERCNAKGVIFLTVMFCEPELFDLPHLIDALKQKGVPTLAIDTEVNQGISGQLRTRIEAFAEMIQ